MCVPFAQSGKQGQAHHRDKVRLQLTWWPAVINLRLYYTSVTRAQTGYRAFYIVLNREDNANTLLLSQSNIREDTKRVETSLQGYVSF